MYIPTYLRLTASHFMLNEIICLTYTDTDGIIESHDTTLVVIVPTVLKSTFFDKYNQVVLDIQQMREEYPVKARAIEDKYQIERKNKKIGELTALQSRNKSLKEITPCHFNFVKLVNDIIEEMDLKSLQNQITYYYADNSDEML